jgi:hypothetical protein
MQHTFDLIFKNARLPFATFIDIHHVRLWLAAVKTATS